jgi:asparagine synthase (glutamine-hydrolysing)
MCGIAGIATTGPGQVHVATLARMAGAIRHRGPDGYGFYTGSHAGFAHVRLSIVDVAGGAQPLANEDGRVVITYNGEVYNHVELRRELAAAGHVFRTKSDTEVLVHAYEQWGHRMLERLNGQFAFAISDGRDGSVFFARDRFGVRPLFYAVRNRRLYFASEVKALLASGEVEASVDPAAIDEVFSFWGPRAPRTGLQGVHALEAGSFAVWQAGHLQVRRYYELDFNEERSEPSAAIAQLDELMRTGVDLRMRADVPVGAYLSGGLDSSITATLAAGASPHRLRSFSIAFSDAQLDESEYQHAVAGDLGSLHASTAINAGTIGEVFPSVVWHAEIPMIRTAPAPMYLLARLTRESGIKVVLTGEGADELFLGYDLFKEVAVRQFCLRAPQSTIRPRLFDRLYPYLVQNGRSGEFWQRFFLSAGSPADPLFSHLPRIALTSWIKQFYSPDFAAALHGVDVIDELRQSLPVRFFGWSAMNRAAYLEMSTLLSGYLLSSQGDRMSMAHGIEGRFPFLDHRLFEFAASLPASSKLRGLKEKEILRRWASAILPPRVARRGKQPYRAPDAPSFLGVGAPSYVQDVLSPDALRSVGLWSERAVQGLLRRCRDGRVVGFRENQAFVAILSTQLWHQQFVQRRQPDAALDVHRADVHLTEAIATAA